MTLDQIYLLMCDESKLRRTVSASPQELHIRGVIDLPAESRGASYVQRLRRQKQLEREKRERAEKRRRRKERREMLLKFKQEQELEHGDQAS